MSLAISKAVGRPGKGTRHTDFEKQSMATMMTMFPLDLWRLMRKSMAICDQGNCGMGRGVTISRQGEANLGSGTGFT